MCVRYCGGYLLNQMKHNHLTVKQVHFIEHTHKITLNTDKGRGAAAS